jgi:DNA replication and repair protein RecF
MHLTRLSLTDFRSYSDVVIESGNRFVVLTGENGAGKTNLLEAVSLLAPGRGLRGATLSEMARSDGPGGFSVAARLVDPSPRRGEDEQARYSPGMAENVRGTFLPRHGEGERASGGGEQPQPPSTLTQPSPSRERANDVEIGTGTTAAAPERRQVRINGAQAAANSLAEWLSVLWLTPAMDRLFTDSAGGRRRFLDRLVLALEPGHAVHAARYEAAMRARNKLLAEEGRLDEDWMTALEARMAEHGAAISRARSAAVAALAARLAEAPDDAFARAGIALAGEQDSDRLAGDLAQGRARDAAAGRTLAGPHRADLAVTHAGKGQPAQHCSTGEQKALLLGTVLAHADLVAERAGRRPILLLDEVAAHLDPSRRAALFSRLGEGGGQVWLTGTERTLFDGIEAPATWFEVADGKIVPK